MDATGTERALSAARWAAASAGLRVDDAVVLHNSNRVVALLVPCNTVARISPMGWFSATREVELARRLTQVDAPVAGPDPRVEPRVITRGGFELTMWTYLEPTPSRALPADEYERTLQRLHAALRRIDITAPRYTDRLAVRGHVKVLAGGGARAAMNTSLRRGRRDWLVFGSAWVPSRSEAR